MGLEAGRSLPNPERLTPREREVAILVAQGLTNQEIADELDISFATARSHLHHILTKLDLRSRTQLAAWVGSSGLATPGL